MDESSLYAITGLAVRQNGKMSLAMANVVATSDDEALGFAHKFIRQQYPAVEGYVQYEAMVLRIFKQAQDPAGRIITVTIREPEQ